MKETLPRAFTKDLTGPQKKLFGDLQEFMARREPKLIWYRKAGSKLGEFEDAVEKRWPGWKRQLAGELGLSMSSLRKMRKFAMDFTRQEAERLDQLGVSWGMVMIVQHARTSNRMKLLERAVANSWGVPDLRAKVTQQFGVRNRGGRPLRKPRTVEEGLMQLKALVQRWLWFHREVWAGSEKPLQDHLRDLSLRERRKLTKVLPGLKVTMQKIRQSAQAAEKLLGELDRKARRS